MEEHTTGPPIPVEDGGEDRTYAGGMLAEGKDRMDVRTPMADADGREGQDGCKDSYGGCYYR